MIRVGRSYRRRPPAGRWDALVIGSGMGGLTAAALLARHGGRRVAVLERHYMPGGFTHVYRRRGYEWDVGVHYIGGVGSERAGTRRLFDHLTDGRLRWASMGEVYDRIVIEDRVYDYVAGPEAFRERMSEYFPGEARAIGRYVDLIRRVGARGGLYFAEKALPEPLSLAVGPLLRAPFLHWARRTTREALSRLTRDPELTGVLTGQFGDYGLPPGRSSFGMHALLARHYLWGGFYPVGGSSAIAAAVAPLIEETGGAVFFQAEVERILVSGNRAVGVRMADGAEVEAPVVVSDAGADNTFQRLLPAETAERHGLRASLAPIGPSAAHLCVYAGLRGTDAELGLPKANFWLYPGPDHDANIEAYLVDSEAPLPLVYASFPSAKDPDFARRCPGRATIELITLAPFERFRPWLGSEWRRRGADYEALKARLAERMLDRLYERLPQLRGRVDYQEVSTPLSTRHFANYERGEIYGLEHSPARFQQRFLRPRTPVRGLYLTGQDVVSCGVAGAMAAGYLTGSVILGRNLLKLATADRAGRRT